MCFFFSSTVFVFFEQRFPLLIIIYMSAITTVTSEAVEAEDDWLTICGRHHKHVYIGWFWFLVFKQHGVDWMDHHFYLCKTT